ncbi:MAG: radical SAM family heme chaperone HemW [Anaerolineaceae bacterium]|nr:radical SAM family heme chaperone HemW [Anaerolineaceae bacterium]
MSLYVHFPFCKKRCSYCDFNTYAGLEHKIDVYLGALCKEISAITAQFPKIPIHTIYFGGGTPTLIPVEAHELLIEKIKNSFRIEDNLEFTIEANPESVSKSDLIRLKGLGINRLSMGLQSVHEDELRMLQRIHSTDTAYNAIDLAREAGFEHVSVDLMYGLPGQTLKKWEHTLQSASKLKISHISLYSLTIEEGTQLQAQIKQGELSPSNGDLMAEMYELAQDTLSEKGFQHYEISNWAKLDERGKTAVSRHNLQYWLNRPYIGIGAGAHSCFNGVRSANINSVKAYINQVEANILSRNAFSPACEETILINHETEMKESMMLGFRLIQEGISDTDFSRRFEISCFEVFKGELNYLLKNELIERIGPQNERVILTNKGKLLGNQVFMQFV